MTWMTTLAVAVGLGMDAFAVSLAVGGLRERLSFRSVFRLSFHFGLFQFLMPVIGWYAGSYISDYLEPVDHWIAFGLLAFIGIKMIRESLADGHDSIRKSDATRGWMLIILSIATSIDALAVGLSMAFLGIDVWLPSAVIGIVACAMTAIGMSFGHRLGVRFGKRMELVGGLILIGIGVKILLEHML